MVGLVGWRAPRIALWLALGALASLGLACPAHRADGVAPRLEPIHQESPMMETNAYLLLEDGSVHEGPPPKDAFYVGGALVDGRFTPTGQVEGEGLLGDAGHPGWMELSSGDFFGDQTARPPFPPYVRGFRTADGAFCPSSRTVTY